MKKQVSKTTPIPTESGAIEPESSTAVALETSTAEVATKPKARKKTAQTPSVAIEVTPVELAPESAAKVRKAKETSTGKTASSKTASGRSGSSKTAKSAPAAADSAFKKGVAAQLDAVKKIRKAKGRDLVTDEPGAEEVADVLGISGDGAEEGVDEVAGEIKPASAEESDAAGPASTAPDSKAPEAKLERLQKILAKAGISSRRKAEELILGGRVQINGQVIMELGTKADMARDHVRVDGKLLQGAERIRYFVLNKPKGYVTTVSDPEGRPTVMQFFSNERERLYPVGRLDYLSEGLLLVTNDGELANKLTKAASGVEKTYLVKVAGHPTEDMLDVLRQGVVIERGRPGTNSGRVRTAPAKIRQVRQGDNPWYEVIVIEGRNRELRKMFEEIGHHVEKIRRIGYGPLVLDLEPGKLRELEAEEVNALRLTADGKLKPKRRKGPAQAQLPTVAGKTVRYKKADGKPGFEPGRAKAVRPEFQQESKSDAYRSTRAVTRSSVKPAARLNPGSAPRGEFRADARPEGRGGARIDSRSGPRAEFKSAGKPAFESGGRPEFNKTGSSRSGSSKPGSSNSGFSKSGSSKPGFAKPGFSKPGLAGKARRPEPPVTEFVLPPRKALPPEPEGGFEDRPSKPALNPDYKPGFRSGGKPPAFRSEGRPGKAPFRKDGPPKRFGGAREEGRSRPQARFDESGASTAPPFSASGDKPKFDRIAGREDYPDSSPEKRVKIGIEPVVERPREQRPRGGGFDRAGGGKPSRPSNTTGGDGPPRGGDRDSRPRPGGRFERPAGRPSGDRPGGFSRGASTRPDSRPRSGSGFDGAPGGRSKPFAGDRERPREFKQATPKPGAPKKFAAKPSVSGKPGPDGEPRKKERWRNSFTGKNKGRPKPKG